RIRAIETDSDCHGEETDLEITFPDWEEETPGICRVENNSGQNMLTGTNTGSTNLRARWTASQWRITIDESDSWMEVKVTANPLASVAVQPRIDSISPSRAVVGKTTKITISGKGFSSEATVNVGSGITTSNVSVNSATEIKVDFNIA